MNCRWRLAVAAPLLLANTLSLAEIVANRKRAYYFGFTPALERLPGCRCRSSSASSIFLIAAFAETNRMPFDLPEAENELVAGFHTEYSSLKFASFFMAEYANMITVAAWRPLLFLGGWTPLFPAEFGSSYVPSLILCLAAAVCPLSRRCSRARPRDRLTLPVVGVVFLAIGGGVSASRRFSAILLPLFWFAAKAGFLLFVFIWVRGTLPRFRYDQLMGFTWKFLFPGRVLNLLVTALLVALFAK